MNIETAEAARKEWDCVVVGGGPAGCQSALYAASEGLRVLLLESGKIGGQIGQTPHLENLLGYEYGISGPCLASEASRDGIF